MNKTFKTILITIAQSIIGLAFLLLSFYLVVIHGKLLLSIFGFLCLLILCWVIGSSLWDFCRELCRGIVAGYKRGLNG